MKKLLIAIGIILCCQGAFALDLELIEGFGNMAYNKDLVSALSEDETDPGTFLPQYYPLVKARFSGEFSGLGYSFGYEREPIMRNRLFANIRIEQEYFFVEGGPFIGLMNTGKLPVNPGFSAVMGLMLPGIVFVQAAGSSTLAAIPMEKKGNYSQISADLSAGFWVPHVICSFNMSIKSFTLRERVDLLIEDELIRYYFRADVFTKNFPYTMHVDLGFQNLKRSYTSMGISVSGTEIEQTVVTDEFKSVFIGAEGFFAVSPALTLILGGEIPVYFWPVRPMKDTPKGIILFEARVGIKLTLSAGNSRSSIQEED